MRVSEAGRTHLRVRWLSVWTAAALVLALAGAAGATVVRQHYEFPLPDLQAAGGYTTVQMSGGWSYGLPGEPVLPMFGARVLLPPGEVISRVSILPGEKVGLGGGMVVQPGRAQAPLSAPGPFPAAAPDPAVYGSASPFPGRWSDEPRVGLYRGFRVATLALHPVEYVPAEGKVSVWRSFDVEIETVPDAGALAETEAMIRDDASTRETLARLIDNPGAIPEYASVPRTSGSRLLDPALGYTYLIITTESWAAACQPLVPFETERGHKAGIFLKSWIAANYTGVDDQAKIRAFIIDAYQTWGVDYVLLVGDARDTNGIPHRGLYSNTSYGDSDTDIPADMYYGCLDGSWNNDGDNLWGEPGEDDLYFEVAVGRACVDEAAEINAFVTKTVRYQSQPVVSECRQALMAGELLWTSPLTYGDTYKEEVRLGSNANGYTTAGFPATMNVQLLYDSQATWTAQQLISAMENGMNIVNHLGHADVTYGMRLYNSDIPSFDNDGINHSYNFAYSQGCYCGAFDNRTSSGGYTDDCFAEEFQTFDRGAAAVIMNSRYGWGDPGGTNGSSQYYDREFFDAMFGEHIYPLGDANDDSKMDAIWALSYGANRWCYYELNLFGDPAMELWTAQPVQLSASYPGTYLIGQTDYVVTVTRPGGLPVTGARCTVVNGDFSVFATGVTDVQGRAVLHPAATAPGTLSLEITAHDFLDFHGQTQVIPPDGPYLVLDHTVILDQGYDGDGCLDSGEEVGLKLAFKNVGIETATNVTGSAVSTDPLVTVEGAPLDFGNIAPGEVKLSPSSLQVTVDANAPDGHLVQWTANGTADQGEWTSQFNLALQAPVLSAGAVMIDDSEEGNGSGVVDPGDVFYLHACLENSGHSNACNLTGILASSDPHVVIEHEGGFCVLAPMGGEGILTGFKVRVSSDCPSPATLAFQVTVTCPSGFETTLDYEVPVGAWVDDAETDRGWSLRAADDNASTGLWVRADPVGTTYGGQPCQTEDDHTAAPGTICFVTGNGTPGGAAGDSDVDGGKTTLLTPVMRLGDAISATISYWRWYTNNLGNNPSSDYWDVDVTSNGSTWVHLEHTTDSANSWSQYTFDLGSYVPLTDQVQVRFVADDESPGSLVEAAVDDFMLTVIRTPASGIEEGGSALGTRLLGCRPNPCRSRTAVLFDLARPMQVRLEFYDVGGRMVRRLIDDKLAAGSHASFFDGRDEAGHLLPSGIYFVRLDTPDVLTVRQVTLLK